MSIGAARAFLIHASRHVIRLAKARTTHFLGARICENICSKNWRTILLMEIGKEQPMSPERRAEIIRQSLLNLHRFKLASDGDVSPSPDATARPDNAFPTGCASSSPPEDPMEHWRREGQEFERAREAGRAQTRAEEERHIEDQRMANQQFFEAVDARISAALKAQREFVLKFLGDAIAAVNEIADATGDKFDQLDIKLDGLAKMLQQLREGNESARARNLVQDLPNPLPRRGLNS
jgi:hypothetical protein